MDASRDKWIYVFQNQIQSNNFISKYNNTIQIKYDPNASKAVPMQKSYFYQTENNNLKHHAMIDLPWEKL